MHLAGDAGLDVEWKPVLTGFEPAAASILQIAFLDRIYIIDLFELGDSPELAAKLRPYLEDPDAYKAGAGIENDF